MRTSNSNVSALSFTQTIYPWVIVCCGMLFYCYNYFLRVSPSTMQIELSDAFHITAYQFGTLAGLYYWSYTPMQVPAGMIYDKFGVRLVLCAAILMAVSGLAIFISATSFPIAECGRLIIGLGTAFAYIGTLKLASIWLPPNRFGTVAGLTTAIGMVSGALTQKYLTTVVEQIGYKQALHAALGLGIALSVFMFLIVKNRPKQEIMTPSPSGMQGSMNLSELLTGLKVILTNKQTWLIGTIGCLLYLPSSVFLDLWGIPYLKSVYNLTAEQAASVTFLTFVGWIISGPIIGYISDKIERRKPALIFVGFFAACLLCTVFYVKGISTHSLYLIFFMIGFCCGAHPLCFALGKESNPLRVAGTSIAVTNMLIMFGGMVFEPLVGLLLDYHTTSPLGANGLPTYAAADYTYALSLVPLGVALGIFLCLFLKETHCRGIEERV